MDSARWSRRCGPVATEVIVELPAADGLRPAPLPRASVQAFGDAPVYRAVECRVERPRMVEHVVERRVPVERVVEREVVVPVEHVVERPVRVDRVVERRVEHPVEVPVLHEQLVEVPVEHLHATPVPVEELRPRPSHRFVQASKPVLRTVELPVAQAVETLLPVPVAVDLPRRVNRYRERGVEQPLDRPVAERRLTERPRAVDRPVEVRCADVREVLRPVERVVEEEVFVDVVLEKNVEVIVEKEVLVHVERVVEVPVEVFVEVPEVTEVLREEDLPVELDTPEFVEEPPSEHWQEVLDPALQAEIDRRGGELREEQRRNAEMKRAHAEMALRAERSRRELHGREPDLSLLSRYMQLLSRKRNAEAERRTLQARAPQRVAEQVVSVNPRAELLCARLQTLLGENARLVAEAKLRRESVSRGLRG